MDPKIHGLNSIDGFMDAWIDMWRSIDGLIERWSDGFRPSTCRIERKKKKERLFPHQQHTIH
jgi:hypothetical protein